MQHQYASNLVQRDLKVSISRSQTFEPMEEVEAEEATNDDEEEM